MEADALPAQDAPPKLTSHKTFPRNRVVAVESELSSNARPSYATLGLVTEASAPPDPSIRAQTPLGSAILLDGEAVLPPTPPSTSRDAVQHAGLASSRQTSGSMKALSSRRSGLSTPTTARSPPTPDITPPSELHLRKPIPSPMISSSTSRAESFQTAMEEQASWSSEDDTDISYPQIGAYQATSGAYQTSTRAYTEATKALRFGEKGLGFDFEQGDGDLTPTQKPRAQLHSPLLLTKLRGAGTHVRSAIDKDSDGPSNADGDWDDARMRNVTLRRTKRPRSPLGQQQHSYEGADAPNPHQSETDSPIALQSTPAFARPQVMDVAKARIASEPTHVLRRNIQDIDAKRISDPASTSAVVEAIIRIAPPPNTRRTLRHVTKNAGLRSFSGSTVEMTRLSSRVSNVSQRHSSDPDKSPLRTLHHKRASVGEHNHVHDLRVNAEASTLHKRPLRHSRDYSHVSQTHRSRLVKADRNSQLRPSTGSSTSTAAPVLGSPLDGHRKSADFEISPPAVVVTSTSVESQSPRPLNDTSSKADSSTVMEQRLGEGEITLSSITKEEGSISGEAPSKPVLPKSVLKSRPERLELGPFPITQEPFPPARTYAASPSTVESQHHLMPVIPPQMLQQAATVRTRHSLNATDVLEDPRRVSFGGGALSTHDALEHATRKSVDSRRSIAYTLDDSTSLYGYSSLYPPVTPLSMSSMRSEAQIAEAKAVNFYPHTNESLLFVQHGLSRLRPAKDMVYPQLNGSPVLTADLHRAIDAIENPRTPTPPPTRITTTVETEDILHLTPPSSAGHPSQAPQLLVEPCTPTTAAAPSEVDSPLRNPRIAPQPPAFKVIPPTPFSEISDPLNQRESTVPQPQALSQVPARRISLMRRARRYSDSFIQPLFTRSVSVKRVIRPVTGDAGARDHNLHPFWRPRGFWDDYSDSESDEDFWGDGELVYADDDSERRLPQGGDTSDVRSLEQQRPPALGRMGSVKKVIMDGFKTSGGFLIGNSLGMERAGTNRRRHQVNLPARLQGRYAPNRGIATLPAHVVDRYGAAGAAHHHAARQSGDYSTTQRLASGSGFTHNPTEPLSLRSAPSHRTPSRSISLSSFPSSYTSTRGSRKRKGWRRNMQFPFRVEYVGIRGMAEKMREKKAEKRREDLRRQIGRGVLQENGFGTLRNL